MTKIELKTSKIGLIFIEKLNLKNMTLMLDFHCQILNTKFKYKYIMLHVPLNI